MTGSSTRDWCDRPASLVAGLLLAATLLVAAAISYANEPAIYVRSADIHPGPDGYVLDATFQIELGSTLEEALTKGVALNFVTELEVVYERWYLLNLINRDIASVEQRYRLSYNALTRQYRVATGALTQNVDSLLEALDLMARVRNRPVAPTDAMEPGSVYAAQLRLRLDTSQLPKPFQINAIGSKSWNLSSDWYRWTVRP